MTDQFIYVTYIRTTPEKLWQALTDPACTREYWSGFALESDWKEGSPWAMKFPNGSINTSGIVMESDPPRRLVLDWNNRFRPELVGEGPSRAAYEIEKTGEVVKVTVTHQAQPNLLKSVSGGWPKVLANLKSYLETGRALLDLPTCAAGELAA